MVLRSSCTPPPCPIILQMPPPPPPSPGGLVVGLVLVDHGDGVGTDGVGYTTLRIGDPKHCSFLFLVLGGGGVNKVPGGPSFSI